MTRVYHNIRNFKNLCHHHQFFNPIYYCYTLMLLNLISEHPVFRTLIICDTVFNIMFIILPLRHFLSYQPYSSLWFLSPYFFAHFLQTLLYYLPLFPLISSNLSCPLRSFFFPLLVACRRLCSDQCCTNLRLWRRNRLSTSLLCCIMVASSLEAWTCWV